MSPAEDVQTSRASWQVPAGENSSAQPLLDGIPSNEPKQPPAFEIDADEIVAAYESVIGDVHDDVLPSVVSVFVLNRVEISSSIPGFTSPFPFGQGSPPDGGSQQEFFYRNGQGSGFVWDDAGHIVTNRHVVVDAERITVVFSDGSDAEAEVIGWDEDSDLAVLKIERDAELLKPVSLGDSNEIRVGADRNHHWQPVLGRNSQLQRELSAPSDALYALAIPTSHCLRSYRQTHQ